MALRKMPHDFLARKKIISVAIFVLLAGVAISRISQRFGLSALYGEGAKKDIYVTRVIDGDTIELSGGERVRYIGIDTPELRKMDKLGRWVYSPGPYAEAAKEFNKKLAEGKHIRLEFDVQKRDRYNRLLAYVYSGDKMVNLELIKEGHAFIYTYPPNVKYAEEFLKAERDARKNEKGIWQDLEKGIINARDAKNNIGLIKMVESEVINTYLSDKALILNCKNSFKAVIFKDRFKDFPKEALRSPDTYFKHKTIRLYGLIKDYKGSPEIIIRDPSQLEILK